MFTTSFGVEWADCDQAGIFYDPRYFYWMDCAFHRFLKARGLSYREQMAVANPLSVANCRSRCNDT
jgi:acyl-CoA thioesterase FadM